MKAILEGKMSVSMSVCLYDTKTPNQHKIHHSTLLIPSLALTLPSTNITHLCIGCMDVLQIWCVASFLGIFQGSIEN